MLATASASSLLLLFVRVAVSLTMLRFTDVFLNDENVFFNVKFLNELSFSVFHFPKRMRLYISPLP